MIRHESHIPVALTADLFEVCWLVYLQMNIFTHWMLVVLAMMETWLVFSIVSLTWRKLTERQCICWCSFLCSSSPDQTR